MPEGMILHLSVLLTFLHRKIIWILDTVPSSVLLLLHWYYTEVAASICCFIATLLPWSNCVGIVIYCSRVTSSLFSWNFMVNSKWYQSSNNTKGHYIGQNCFLRLLEDDQFLQTVDKHDVKTMGTIKIIVGKANTDYWQSPRHLTIIIKNIHTLWLPSGTLIARS